MNSPAYQSDDLKEWTGRHAWGHQKEQSYIYIKAEGFRSMSNGAINRYASWLSHQIRTSDGSCPNLTLICLDVYICYNYSHYISVSCG